MSSLVGATPCGPRRSGSTGGRPDSPFRRGPPDRFSGPGDDHRRLGRLVQRASLDAPPRPDPPIEAAVNYYAQTRDGRPAAHVTKGCTKLGTLH